MSTSYIENKSDFELEIDYKCITTEIKINIRRDIITNIVDIAKEIYDFLNEFKKENSFFEIIKTIQHVITSRSENYTNEYLEYEINYYGMNILSIEEAKGLVSFIEEICMKQEELILEEMSKYE